MNLNIISFLNFHRRYTSKVIAYRDLKYFVIVVGTEKRVIINISTIWITAGSVETSEM